MSLFAFEDELRQKKALAVKCSDRSKRFYCPDPQCDAHLFLCNQDGVSKAYFRATLKSHPHNLVIAIIKIQMSEVLKILTKKHLNLIALWTIYLSLPCRKTAALSHRIIQNCPQATKSNK